MPCGRKLQAPTHLADISAPVSFPTSHWRAVHLLALIVVVAAAWAARDLLIPILLALFLALIANPLVTRLCNWHVPRWIGALFVVFGGVILAITLASQLVAPASDWFQKAPKELRQIAPKLKSITKQVDAANKAAQSLVTAAGTAPSKKEREAALAQDKPKPPNLWTLIRAAPRMLALFGAVILLAYFFVVYGVGMQRNFIAMLPDRHRKRLTADLLHALEMETSRYVLTITIINAVLALLLTAVLWALGLGLGDALLWGAIGGLLNYAPYVGPTVGVITFGLVGVVAFDSPMKMLAPPAIYLGMQMLESEVITPLIIGKRWSISPLVILLWLLFCAWLWGIAGVLLAMPVLVCFKIVAERVPGMNGWSAVIE